MALTKIDDRGLKTPIDLQDNEKIRLGTGNDLEVFHDGSDSKIVTSTGDLWVQTTADDLVFKAADDINFHPGTTETGLLIKHDAEVEAYYDNVKKIATKSYGVQLYDDLQLEDNNKIRLGNSGDLDIYHDGSNSYIKDAGTGGIYIDTSFLHVRQGSGESMINAVADGQVELYYNNSKKFETHSGGITVTGNIDCTGNIKVDDSDELRLGTGNDLKIYHNGSHNYISGEISAQDVYLQGKRDIYIKSGDNNGGYQNSIYMDNNGGVHLYYDNSKKFQTTSSGITVTDTGNTPIIQWNGASNNPVGKIDCDQASPTTSDMRFHTENSGSLGEKLRITPSGNLGVTTTNPTMPLDVRRNNPTSGRLACFGTAGTPNTAECVGVTNALTIARSRMSIPANNTINLVSGYGGSMSLITLVPDSGVADVQMTFMVSHGWNTVTQLFYNTYGANQPTITWSCASGHLQISHNHSGTILVNVATLVVSQPTAG